MDPTKMAVGMALIVLSQAVQAAQCTAEVQLSTSCNLPTAAWCLACPCQSPEFTAVVAHTRGAWLPVSLEQPCTKVVRAIVRIAPCAKMLVTCAERMCLVTY